MPTTGERLVTEVVVFVPFFTLDLAKLPGLPHL